MRTSRRSKGASLLELAAGFAMVAVALLGAVGAVVSGASLTTTTIETSAAQRIASAVLEEVRGADFATLAATYHGQSRPVTEFGLTDSDGAADIVVAEVDNGSAAWTVYEVRVLVRWARSGTPRAIEVVTYVGDRVRGTGLSTPVVLGAEG